MAMSEKNESYMFSLLESMEKSLKWIKFTASMFAISQLLLILAIISAN
jgi:hypothetical protein